MEAMITTIGGLIVGIIAYVGYNYLVSKVEKVVHNMEITSLKLIDSLDDLKHAPKKPASSPSSANDSNISSTPPDSNEDEVNT